MSRKKLRYLAWAVAAVLAFTPFLHGCAEDRAEEQPVEEAVGIAEVGETNDKTFAYGEVTQVDGLYSTVDLGTMADAVDADDPGAFEPDGTQITIDFTGVALTDSDGGDLPPDQLQVGNVLMMTGTGEGADFQPERAEVLGAPDVDSK